MTKQLIALALVAAFGVAHAADVKPATESKPAAVKVAADPNKTGPDAAIGNVPETTAPAGTNKAPAKKMHKHGHKHHKAHKKNTGAAAGNDQSGANTAAPAQPASK